MICPEHTREELQALRRFAEVAEDWAEARRLTEALLERGAVPPPSPEPANPRAYRHLNRALDDRAIRAIRRAYAEGERPSVLARAFGVTPQTIRNVGRGITYRDVS